jgi:YfiH family protein
MSLEFLTSDALKGVRHGFFTRKGGVSRGIYSSLNCGPGSSDLSAAVAANRARVAERVLLPPGRLLSLCQVHSADVVVADADGWTTPPVADAAVAGTPGIALGILTADCAPVLFSDASNGVIGAAHAGWRGALEGVLEATIEQMEALGARRASIRAAVGPAISQRAYEVGPEFFERFTVDEPDFSRFFAGGEADRMLFDLPGFVLERLRASGVEAAWTGHCTFGDAERFFSYRRATHAREPDYGRMISVISLKAAHSAVARSS